MKGFLKVFQNSPMWMLYFLLRYRHHTIFQLIMQKYNNQFVCIMLSIIQVYLVLFHNLLNFPLYGSTFHVLKTALGSDLIRYEYAPF